MSTTLANSWAALLPAALAGTGRQPFVPLPGLTPSLGAEADTPEKQLLLTAANLGLVQRAGHRPHPGPAALPPLPPETWPVLSEAAAQGLETLLAEEPEKLEAWASMPQELIVLNMLTDLRQLRYRLPPRTVLRLLRSRWGRFLDATTARRVLGRRGRWLYALLGDNHSSWYRNVADKDWETLTPQKRYSHLVFRIQYPMPPDDSYVNKWVELPAEQRTQLLWQAWQHNAGQLLPPPLQMELDTLLATTPLAERPWTTKLRQVEGLSSHPRLAGHPLLARLAEWAAPLLQLERPAGRPPRVRIELPIACDPAWKQAGLDPSSTHFPRRNNLEFCLQELLCTLGPRHWADAWQLPPAEVVALVAAAPRGRLVLEAWCYSLCVEQLGSWSEPEFVRALLALPQCPTSPVLRTLMLRALPLTEQVAHVTALLPADVAAPHEPEWAQLVPHRVVPEPSFLRALLPVLAGALVQPRTPATVRQAAGLAELLHYMNSWAIDAGLYPEVQAALGTVVPLLPKCAQALKYFLRGLALRYSIRQACGATALATGG